jgi:protein SSD1
MDALPLHGFAYDKGSLTVYWKQNIDVTMDTVAQIRETNKTENRNTCAPIERKQVFETFTAFDVLIQVNIERTPPIINIYPVNPFLAAP